VAGGKDTSVQQPQWGPDGALNFISDASGWWNLYRTQLEQDSQVQKAWLLLAVLRIRMCWDVATYCVVFLHGISSGFYPPERHQC
jgi:hypothetical protein